MSCILPLSVTLCLFFHTFFLSHLKMSLITWAQQQVASSVYSKKTLFSALFDRSPLFKRRRRRKSNICVYCINGWVNNDSAVFVRNYRYVFCVRRSVGPLVLYYLRRIENSFFFISKRKEKWALFVYSNNWLCLRVFSRFFLFVQSNEFCKGTLSDKSIRLKSDISKLHCKFENCRCKI